MKDPKELADKISQFINSSLCGEDELRDLAKAMAADHPTLLQKKMKLVMMFIEEMSERSSHDLRIKGTVEKAKQIIADNYKREVKRLMDEEYMNEEKAKDVAEKYLKLSSNLPLI